jgi:hypothetical protein
VSYGGESNAKKLARGNLWLGYRDIWSAGRIEDRNALVIAGPEAADVRAAKAIGIDPTRILAVDTDGDHIAASKQIVPEAEYVKADVFDVLLRDKRKYDIMFFDFCQTLSDKLLRQVIRAARERMRRDGLLILGAMYGRERESEVKSFINKSKELLGHTDNPAATSRVRAIWQWLKDLCLMYRLLASPAMFVSYRSGKLVNGRSVGVPMVYAGFFVCSYKRFQGRTAAALAEEAFFQRLATSIGRQQVYIKDYGDDAHGEKLRHEVLRLASHGKSSQMLAEVFNLKRQQIAAWKAWETMRKTDQGGCS